MFIIFLAKDHRDIRAVFEWWGAVNVYTVCLLVRMSWSKQSKCGEKRQTNVSILRAYNESDVNNVTVELTGNTTATEAEKEKLGGRQFDGEVGMSAPFGM